MKKVQALILSEFEKLKNQYKATFNPFCENQFEQIIFPTLSRRVDNISVRSSFVFGKYLFLYRNAPHGTFRPIKKDVLTKLAFLIDAAMSVIYLYNHVYDKKYKLKVDDIGTRMGAGNILKDVIYEYVQEELSDYALIINKKLRKAYSDIDHGQVIDQKFNFEDLENDNLPCSDIKQYADEHLLFISDILADLKEKYPAYKNSLDVYFTRIYLVSSSLFRAFDEILFELMDIKVESKAHKSLMQKSLAFSDVYGILMQVVNDNNDFVLDADTSNKKSNDVLSDLRNQTVSLPMICFKASNMRKGLVSNYISKASSYSKAQSEFKLKGKHNEVLKEMILSRALLDSMELGRKLMIRCKTILGYTKRTDMLVNAAEIANNNRYYHHIYKAKRAYIQGKYYKCEENMSMRAEINKFSKEVRLKKE